MQKFIKVITTILFSIFINGSFGQSIYKYAVDLTAARDNVVHVVLQVPKVSDAKVNFCFPKIIPGTYMISDFGNFIKNVKAFNKEGNSLTVKKINTDKWAISNASEISKITYDVEGIFDTKEKHKIFPMAATSIEPEDIVVNSPGFFGYFENQTNLSTQITFIKPAVYYASTSMSPFKTSSTEDVFKLNSIQNLYDEPILYCIPDTATIQVGNCSVLFSVYSPDKKVHAADLASAIQKDLGAVKKYLGGKLPTDKYAFIYYLHKNNEAKSFPKGLGGALEHMTSSFYYLPEFSLNDGNNFFVDASLHEFFHIITPLTISSDKIKNFNFDIAVLSEHLWLYEGSTEYNAQYVQARYSLIAPEEFLFRLTEKITQSQTKFNDTLSFTELSKGSADKYNDQYENVYQKGAMISACLDLYLLHLSHGNYGLRNLTHDLGEKYGTNRTFKDEELFDEIGKLTFPEVKNFLIKYVSGNTPLDYKYFFSLAGINYIEKIEKKVLTFGKVGFGGDSLGNVTIENISKMNDFGKAMGYKVGDIIYAYNGLPVTGNTLGSVIDNVKSTLKEGDYLTARIGRRNQNGEIQPLELKAKIYNVKVTDLNVLNFDASPSQEQLLIRKAWLTDSTDAAYDKYIRK